MYQRKGRRLPKWAPSQQRTDVEWMLCTKGQSVRQGQMYTLSSHLLHLSLHYCLVTVLTTYSPLCIICYESHSYFIHFNMHVYIQVFSS